jgi:hypothetical protein
MTRYIRPVVIASYALDELVPAAAVCAAYNIGA